MPVGTLFAILGLLPCRTAAVGTGDILLFLGFGLHLTVVFRLVATTTEVNAVLEDLLKIVHIYNL